jgi:hypothetical protein
MATERINVSFPKALLDELRRYVPLRERSALIVRATERELRRVRLQASLAALATEPAWALKHHPELTDGPAIDRVLAESRAAWQVASEGDSSE